MEAVLAYKEDAIAPSVTRLVTMVICNILANVGVPVRDKLLLDT